MPELSKEELSKTLNLPRTGFPMKAGLHKKEPETLERWDRDRVYEGRLEKNKESGKTYVLHDGPPYANGHLHIGHALNKILKDIIVKYKLLNGYYAPYVPGWDCHGLPIELQVDKKLGKKKAELSLVERRRRCRDYAAEFVDIQREEFKRMGVFGIWDRPYLTMDYGYESTIVREFCRFVRQGSVYHGKKPVHWCPSCATALAEAEVEYDDKTSPSVYVSFSLDEETADTLIPERQGRRVGLLIWTTTPWTLPANRALAVHPDLEYAAVDKGDEILIVSAGRLAALRDEIGLDGNELRRFSGAELEGLAARHPFYERTSTIITAPFVSDADGSGVVHIAPGHGEDDFEAGLAHKLEVFAPVDDRGRFTADAEPWAGQFVFKANTEIIETLKERGALHGAVEISHSYPHCWRCKKPVIFRATEQWFISMEHGELRERALEEIDRVRWIPDTGKNRIRGMVENRPDWCISRQRAWGVPITLLKCTHCGTFTDDDPALDNFVALVEEHGADVWFDRSPQDLLPDGYVCRNCGGTSFDKETDILDVWFDSGVSHAAVLERNPDLAWPADLYLEGSDQHRGWFQSTLLTSVGTRKAAAYHTVLTHGFTVDGRGKKMSKSQGNVVSPQDVIKQRGTEILRLWVSAADYREDMRISGEILDRLVEAYRKIRNTCRYLLGNLADFDPAEEQDPATLSEIDRWAYSRLQALIEAVTRSYEAFAFHEVYHAVYQFCIVEMSSFYFDVLKDRLYTFHAHDPARRGSQWVLYRILKALTTMIAPILSFTAEEVWEYTPGAVGSVFDADFPKADAGGRDPDLESRWASILKIRDEVNRALEVKRREKLIGNSLEADVTLFLPDEWRTLLEPYATRIPEIFIVSSGRIAPAADLPAEATPAVNVEGMSILVTRAAGEKCDRCWNWRTDATRDGDGPLLCGRCRGVLAS